MVDFSTRTPIEFLSLQNNERSHAEMLAWVISGHSGFGQLSLAILDDILGADTFPGLDTDAGWTVTSIDTEFERLDLLVELRNQENKYIIAIEFKMKSVESVDQLSRYDALLARLFPDVPPDRLRKVFLTVCGESPRSGTDWHPRRYSDVRRALSQIAPVGCGPCYLRDYQQMLDRILACTHAVTTDPTHAAALLSTAPPGAAGSPIDTQWRYATDMKIRNLLSKAWVGAVAEFAQSLAARGASFRLRECRVEAGGAIKGSDGVVNFYLAELTATDGTTFRHGLQVQGTSLKAFVEPYPDRKLDATGALFANDLHAALLNVRNTRPGWGGGTSRAVAPDENGHRSIAIHQVPRTSGGAPLDPADMKGSYDVPAWADLIVAAVSEIRRQIGPLTFPTFAWRDLAAP